MLNLLDDIFYLVAKTKSKKSPHLLSFDPHWVPNLYFGKHWVWIKACGCGVTKYENVHGVWIFLRVRENETQSSFMSCREGRNQYEKTFGLPSAHFFQAIYRLVLIWLLKVLHWLTSSLLVTVERPPPQVWGGDAEIHGDHELSLGSGRTRCCDGVRPLPLPEGRRSGRWGPAARPLSPPAALSVAVKICAAS